MNTLTKNAEVKAVSITNINDEKQLYVTISTERGKVAISVGEKNFTKLTELLTSIQADANRQPTNKL